MLRNKIVTSEYVSPGHPDKIADLISDALLDAYLLEDENTRAGIEVMVKDNIVVIGGEVKTNAFKVNVDEIVRSVYGDLAFPRYHHLDPNDIKVINIIGQQSSEIHNGVDRDETTIGAGDQGFMVGYANNETDVYMPLGHYLAKRIVLSLYKTPGLGPDAKSQVVVSYDENGIAKVTSVLVSIMRNAEGLFTLDSTRDFVKDAILNRILPLECDKYGITEDIIDVNPCGDWTVGGPVADCGLTGRKIVVDQFGGYSNVGGGAHSGKCFTKVDRSAAYLCRYYAKNIVASGIANEAKVELAYMIGVPEPCAFNIEVDTDVDVNKIREVLRNHIKPIPYEIIKRFNISFISFGYNVTKGAYGQKGSPLFPWEVVDEDLCKSLQTIV